jgi:CHAT domain-containing protein
MRGTASPRQLGAADPFIQLRKIGAQFVVGNELNAADMTPGALEEKARELVTSLRGGMRSPAGRAWASHELDSIYGPILERRLEAGQVSADLVFSAAEATKARTLLDRMQRPPAPLPAKLRLAALDLEKRALGFNRDDTKDPSRTWEEMRLISQLQTTNGDTGRWDAVRKLEELYESSSAGFSGVSTPVSSAQVVKALHGREAILEYFVPYNARAPSTDVWAIAISPSGVRAKQLDLSALVPQGMVGTFQVDGKAPIDSGPLGNLVVNLRTAIRESRDDDAKPMLASLYEMLIGQTKSIGIDPENLDRLIIVPHGPLHYVPFPALLAPGGKFLAQHVAISLAPSASVLLALEHAAAAPRTFLALAPTPPPSANTAPLEQAVAEANAAASSLKGMRGKVLTARDADLAGLTREAVEAGVIHFSAHGQFPDDDAADSHYLWLSAGASFDGRLTASLARDLRLAKTGLVVLSVCNGAIYRDGPGDEPYGLMPAFLAAGASNVLGALWPIEEGFSPRFMKTFYDELTRSGPAKAHQATMKAFIKKDEFIRKWAGFVLVGPGAGV